MKLSAIGKMLWGLVRGYGEDKGQEIVRETVAEVNEEAQKALLTSGPTVLADALAEVGIVVDPQSLVPVVVTLAGKLEPLVQQVVDRGWAEVGKLDPTDVDGPAPDVDLDGAEK